MAEAKEALYRLEDAFRRYDKLAEVIIVLMTTDERKVTLYDSLVAIEEHMGTLNDARLRSLYDRLVEGRRTFMPQYEQILQADYKAFIQRLNTLAIEAAVEANEADVALKAALNLDASTGIWGPKGWRPPQQPS